MPMLPEQLGLLADFLKNSSSPAINKECLLRACAGRNYYEIFHVVRTFLSLNYNNEYQASGGGTHQALQVCCSLISDKLDDSDFEKLKLKLHNLHGIRVKADYNLDGNFSEGEVITVESEKKRTYQLLAKIVEKYSLKSA